MDRLEQDENFFRQIRKRFLAEAKAVEAITVPEWQLSKDGQLVEPNRMQKMTAYHMTQRRTWGNWSGAGAGKTAAAGLAAYVVNSKLTVIIANNSTISGWRRQLQQTFSGATVVTRVKDVKRGRGMFLVINYEKFQQHAPVDEVVALSPDMIVLDEVQMIKHRKGDDESRRRAALTSLLQKAPTAKVLCMSATPVINDLSEGASLAEISSDKKTEIKTRKTISNALDLHYELLKSGLRYRPQYRQTLTTQIVEARRDDLLDVVENCADILSLEQALLLARLEASKHLIQPGVILYSEFVEKMTDVAVEFVRALGLTATCYTGNEDIREREIIQQKFVEGSVDVLVASRAVAVGVDGLQERCSRMILLSLPWTHAAYEQLIGRVYRQGSAAAQIEVIIPQILVATAADNSWSWDKARWDLLESKRTLSECATDGIIPNLLAVEKNRFFGRVVAKLAKSIRSDPEETAQTPRRAAASV